MEIRIIQPKNSFEDSFRIISKSGSIISELAKTFSVPDPGAFFARQYGYNAPSRIYAVNQFGYFQKGLIFEVLKYLKINYPSINIVLENDVKVDINKRLPLRDFVKSGKYTKPDNISKTLVFRDYQEETINAVITKGYGRCMFENPTGSGKSLVLANIIYTLTNQYKKDLRTLIFLPNAQLVSQFDKDLKKYGFTDFISYTPKTQKKLTDEEILKCRIIISNRQFLFNHIKKIGNFDLLLFDEVHSCAPDSKTEKLINSLKIPLKIGCSGTIPKDTKHKYWRLLHVFGPIVFTEEIIKLQERGFLTNVKFTLIKVKDMVVEKDRSYLFHQKPLIKYTPVDKETNDVSEIAFNDAYIAETDYMSENCMHLYSPVLEKISLAKGNTLILFDRIEFGKSLFEYIKTSNFNNSEYYYIDGSIDVDIREEIRKICEEKSNIIIIAQVSIMSTGINIKNLSNLIITGSSKSQSRTIQSIGRLLRLHKDKKFANIYDIVFFNFKYSRRHYNERLNLYKKYYEKNKPDAVIDIVID